MSQDRHCPLCGEPNDCRLANGCAYKGACWCEAAIIPISLQRHLANEFPEPACLCQNCLTLLERYATQPDHAQNILERVNHQRTLQKPPPHLRP